jgi:hypothetical protein
MKTIKNKNTSKFHLSKGLYKTLCGRTFKDSVKFVQTNNKLVSCKICISKAGHVSILKSMGYKVFKA